MENFDKPSCGDFESHILGFATGNMQFNVKGVSFDKRPEAIKSLVEGEAIMMVPEPENPYSGRALAIKKLDGTMLGYTPEEHCGSPLLSRLVQFGKVVATGEIRTKPGLYWLTVSFESSQRALHIVAAPRNLQDLIYNEGAKINVSASACRAVDGRCQVTGMRRKALSIVPEWYEDTKTHTFLLKGFIHLAPELKDARDSILSEQPSPEAIDLLMDANRWDEEEVLNYIGYLHDLQDQRENEDWKVDVSTRM